MEQFGNAQPWPGVQSSRRTRQGGEVALNSSDRAARVAGREGRSEWRRVKCSCEFCSALLHCATAHARKRGAERTKLLFAVRPAFAHTRGRSLLRMIVHCRAYARRRLPRFSPANCFRPHLGRPHLLIIHVLFAWVRTAARPLSTALQLG